MENTDNYFFDIRGNALEIFYAPGLEDGIYLGREFRSAFIINRARKVEIKQEIFPEKLIRYADVLLEQAEAIEQRTEELLRKIKN